MTPVSNYSPRATRTPSSSSTPSVDGARMTTSLSPPELSNIKPSLMTVPSIETTSSSLSGLPPCSTVAPPKFYGTPPPELDVVSLTSLPEETPLVLVTPLKRVPTSTTDGTDKSSLCTPRDSSVEWRSTPSKWLPLTRRPTRWNSSAPLTPMPSPSNSSLVLRCVSTLLITSSHQRAS